MRALKLDFVRRPSPFRWLGFFFLAAAVATAAYLLDVYLKRSAELERWEEKYRSLQKAQRKQAPSTVKTAELEHLQSELKAANRIIAHLALPWDALFREVEASVDDQVTLLTVEPDTEKRELRIVAEAKNLEAMLGYMNRVRAISLFKDAYVVSHQIQQQDPQKPLRFVVNSQWLDLPRPTVESSQTIVDAVTVTVVGNPE